MEDYPLILFIDLFCGAGGVTTGAVRARMGKYQPIKVIACVNHDPLAIESHEYNHSDTLHFSEDIRTLDLKPLLKLIRFYRSKYPDAIVVLWASLECTNYSKAKGGQPRDPDSRSLPNEIFRYIDAINNEAGGLDYFKFENVEEFMAWGPLDEDGRPESMKKGQDYLKWVQKIKDRGYRYERRILNAADYGAYTKRRRLFGIFAKGDLPISWPAATHSEEPKENMFGKLRPWKPVRDCLDFNDEGESIFTRDIPFVWKTHRRIYDALPKYYLEGDGFISKYYGNGINADSLDEPAATLTTKDRMRLVWLDKQYNGKLNHQSINAPAGSITSNPKLQLIQAFIDRQFSNGTFHQSINKPAGAILTVPKMNLVTIHPGINYPNYLEIKESDDRYMIKIKKFCVKHGIVDIKSRMLRVHELKTIQGFGANYYMAGTKTDQKKFIGNSVPPDVVKAIMETLANGIAESEKAAA